MGMRTVYESPPDSPPTKWGRRLLLATTVALGISGCARSELIYQPVAEPFPAVVADFADYRAAVRAYLDRHRVAVDPLRDREEIELNLPFEISAAPAVPYRGRFLLFHGLNDSPFVWRDMATRLSRLGFDVRAPLLPGHGSRPGDMLDVRFEQWLETGRSALRAWRDDGTPLYLGGFSMGGVVATTLALEEPDISGLLLIAPAFRSSVEDLLRWSSLMALFRDWAFTQPPGNPVRYDSVATNSGAQFYQLTRYLAQRWGDRTLSIPALMVLTAEDSVVDVAFARKLFGERLSAPQNRLILYSANGNGRAGPREAIRDSRNPGLRILNQSHMSLMIAPDNRRYGVNGDLHICNDEAHTFPPQCADAPRHWHGAWGTPPPDEFSVARTTYNPDFEFLAGQVAAVFAPAASRQAPVAGR